MVRGLQRAKSRVVYLEVVGGDVRFWTVLVGHEAR